MPRRVPTLDLPAGRTAPASPVPPAGVSPQRASPRSRLLLGRRGFTWACYVVAQLLFLVWLAKELGPLGVATGVVTPAWGVYGAVLLLAAL